MSCFKLTLASHAIKNEFEFNTEKSYPGRYRATIVAKLMDVGGGFMLLQMEDNLTVKVALPSSRLSMFDVDFFMFIVGRYL